MYDLRAIANYFIEKAQQGGIDMSPMKLQKILYFAYGLYLALYGKPLFSDRFEVWKYGPVISQVYYRFRGYGSRIIDQPLSDLDLARGEIVTPRIDKENKELLEFLDNFWKTYKNYSAVQLSNATHLEKTPWVTALKNNKAVIDDAEMKDYFSSWLAKR